LAEDQDWRLEGELESTEDHHGLLERLVGGLRDEYASTAEEVRAAAGDDVVVTHDGQRLFVYANAEAALSAARQAIESACQRRGLRTTIVVSHWDRELDRWRRVDPPETPSEAAAARAADREGETVETQTVVCNAGRTLRASLEQAMRDRAAELGLECELVEHRHLLTTQVAFTITGPRHKIDEFRSALEADAWASIRADSFGTGLI
jgi:hypothetical protein